MRTTTIIHSAVAMPVTKKQSARPLQPINNTGRRPSRSERRPRIGEPEKFATPNAIVIAPYRIACSDCELVNVPINGASTGMIGPIDTMSIGTAALMSGIAALRPAGCAIRCIIPFGNSALPS